MSIKQPSLLFKIGQNHTNTPILLTLNSHTNYRILLQELVAGIYDPTVVDGNEFLNSYNCVMFDGSFLKRADLEGVFDFIQTKPLKKTDVKLLVIENIQDLSVLIANALLKTLEELPDYLYVVLTTNDIGNVLATIKSRCNIVHATSTVGEDFHHPLVDSLAPDMQQALIRSFGNVNSLASFLETEDASSVITWFQDLVLHAQDELYLMQQMNSFVKLDYKLIKILINWLSAYYPLKDQSCFKLVIENYDLNLAKNYLYFCVCELLIQK